MPASLAHRQRMLRHLEQQAANLPLEPAHVADAVAEGTNGERCPARTGPCLYLRGRCCFCGEPAPYVTGGRGTV
jgi:hypothetical protein